MYGTHNLWYTDSSVDFWLSQRNKKAKSYILLWCSCFIMTCTLSHEPYQHVRLTFHIICPSIGIKGPLLSWSFDSWIFNYKCNQCLSPLTLWVRIWIMARRTRYIFIWYIFSVTLDRTMIFSEYPCFSKQ